MKDRCKCVDQENKETNKKRSEEGTEKNRSIRGFRYVKVLRLGTKRDKK